MKRSRRPPVRNDIEILAASEESHLAAIQQLAHEIWHEHYPGIISEAQIEYMLELGYSRTALRRDVQQRGIHYERALSAGALVGFSAYGPGQQAEMLMLHKLYVRLDHRRSGAGRGLVESALRFARENGYRGMLLTVNKGNGVAIAAYERMGFENCGPIVTDIGAGFVMDDYLLELRAAPASRQFG